MGFAERSLKIRLQNINSIFSHGVIIHHYMYLEKGDLQSLEWYCSTSDVEIISDPTMKASGMYSGYLAYRSECELLWLI